MFNNIPALPEKTYRLNKLKLQEAFRIIVLHYFSDLRVKIWSHTAQELRAAKFQLRINAANCARTHQGLVVFSCDVNYKHLMHIELTMCMPAHAQTQLNWEIFRGVSRETGSITHLSIYSTGPLKFVKSPLTDKTPGSLLTSTHTSFFICSSKQLSERPWSLVVRPRFQFSENKANSRQQAFETSKSLSVKYVQQMRAMQRAPFPLQKPQCGLKVKNWRQVRRLLVWLSACLTNSGWYKADVDTGALQTAEREACVERTSLNPAINSWGGI